MSASLNDRFAHVAALRAPQERKPLPAKRSSEVSGESDCLAELLGAVVARNRYGEHLQVRRWYASPEAEGLAPTKHALRLLLPVKAGKPAAAHERVADPAEWLFLDTETTGLAGGTGTYAFLVGVAWWEAGGLQVEQFFMRDYSEEHSLLLELSRHLAERRVLVTFNGKSFDWPLLETRYLMTRAIAPHTPLAHLDLLYPARQLWRLRLGSVRLTELERHVLGSDRLGWDRRDDLDAAFIPQIYFDYLRGGPPERLTSVFRHNQMDLRGLAALAGRIFALLSEPEASSDDEIHAWEFYGLARLLLRRGEPSKARLLYERALDAGLSAAMDRAARRELARLAKRERDFARANALWEDLLQCSSHRTGRARPARNFAEKMGAASSAPTGGIAARRVVSESVGAQHAVPLRRDYETASNNSVSSLDTVLEAYEQLAIYYEHRAREPARAAGLTREALARLRSSLRAGRLEPGRYRRWQTRLEHRLARLMRRTQAEDRGPLFEPASAEAGSHPRESNREAARGEIHPRTRRI